MLPLVSSLGERRGWHGRERRRTSPTIDDVDPIRHLGVHPAIQPVSGQAGLPALTVYVERPHDEHLRVALGNGWRDSVLLVVGGSSTGKTRACYEALHAVLPDSVVLRPANDEELLALLRADLEPGAVVWLDEAQRYFDGRHGGDVARALHLMLDATPRPGRKRVVIGSMWSREIWSSDDDDEQAVRELLGRPGVVVPVCEAFPAPEHVERAAQRDSRWRDALAASGGVNVVNYLAGGPFLVRHIEQGRYGPDARALLTAAMDAHCIGFWSPLPLAVLEEAARGYLRPQHDPIAVSRAVADAMQPVCGIGALTRADGHDDAVVLHSYLAQHAREVRRREPIPDSLWAAVTSGVDDDGDRKRVIDSTLVRGLVRWGMTLLRRCAEAGDDTAAQRLAGLLHVRGDPEAVAELRERASQRVFSRGRSIGRAA